MVSCTMSHQTGTTWSEDLPGLMGPLRYSLLTGLVKIKSRNSLYKLSYFHDSGQANVYMFL